MALKPATDIQLDAEYQYIAVQVTAKGDGFGADAPQKTNPEGVPMWTVDALRTGPDGSAVLSVTIPAQAAPEVAGPVVFRGLRAGLWLGERARQGGIYWQADAVVTAGQQTKRD